VEGVGKVHRLERDLDGVTIDEGLNKCCRDKSIKKCSHFPY